jgi:N utilization substance protein A
MLDPELLGDLLGRISAQTAKQVMIQKIREAERDTLYEEYLELRSQLISGQVTRVDRGTVIVSLGKVEAILPRSEQIRKENYRTGDRVRAIVLDVRKAGSRVRVILSRTHADFVRRLFEVEIPEVNDRVIEVRSISREAGNRSKVAVSCGDTSIDCVGACVGVRGARIRGIVEELAGERIDIVRWNDSLSILVPNALQPAEVEDVILCPMLGKVIVLVREDQLSLAIGKFGQNVRLASKLVGWDIHVMTQDLLDQQLDKSIEAFCVVPEVTAELAENLVSQGFFTFDDLSVIEPDQLAEIGGLSDEDCDKIVEYADRESQRLEAEEKIAAELKKQTAAYGEAPKPKAVPPVTEAAIQEPETVPPEIIVDSSAALEE